MRYYTDFEIQPNIETVKKQKITYYNIACAFDIETSTFAYEDKYRANCYLWQFGMNDNVCYGRTWNEFNKFIVRLSNQLDLSTEKRLVVYVHNLEYEFQWIRKYFEWETVFSLKKYRPIYAVTRTGIEFRCNYLLSGLSLAKVGENLQKYKVRKKVGDLDYNLLRHSSTPLADKELGYAESDILVVTSYIREQMEQYGDISKIPWTKTGKVRKYCRDHCMKIDREGNKVKYKALKWNDFMRGLTVTPEEYEVLKDAFAGGFTHANYYKSNKVIYNVGSFDLTSSYPAVMVMEQYPMSKGRKIKILDDEQFNRYLQQYCCIFDIHFENIRARVGYEHPLSLSKCRGYRTGKDGNPLEYQTDNGRVMYAEEIITTITNVDYYTLKAFYEWDKMDVKYMWVYLKSYLPTDFIYSILKLYEQKTTLKGVEGKELEYLNSKEQINSAYGMSVTDICRPEYVYNGEWQEPKEPDIEQAIKEYNKSRSRFLFYPWGIFVTAYARRNLFRAIAECKCDYCYSDTDSCKTEHAEKHLPFFENYNREIEQKLKVACEYHNIPFEMCTPMTIKGEHKLLGAWEYEGQYTRFKTLGAKRYLYEENEKFVLTVAGLNKSKAMSYLLDKYGTDGVFNAFSNQLDIPSAYTGKLTHSYIDEPTSGTIIDYLGNEGEYDEKSSIALIPASYHLSMDSQYIELLKSVYEYEVE